MPSQATREAMLASVAPFLSVFSGPVGAALRRPGIASFAFGNPNEMPLPGYVDGVRRHLEPQDADWFAYKMSEPTRRPSSRNP